jgi:predicted dehydrogenase
MNREEKTLRTAVVGVGHLGRHHARILSSLPGVELVAVVDVDPGRAAAVAAATGGTPLGAVEQLPDDLDAVVVAVPTERHLETALPLIQRGIGVLVEKPLASSSGEAEALIAAARRSGTTLATGHTERHNPAVSAAIPLLQRPRFIEVHRLGTFPERSLDIDVVFDLMIHDLDVVLACVGGEVTGIEAIGVPVLTDRVDIASVRLRFASGCLANLTASRISRERVRKIRFFQPEGYLSLDYAQQELEMFRLVRQDGARPSIEGGRIDVAREEPLRLELLDFLAAVRSGRPPAVTGEDGLRAVALAERIVARMSADVAVL